MTDITDLKKYIKLIEINKIESSENITTKKEEQLINIIQTTVNKSLSKIQNILNSPQLITKETNIFYYKKNPNQILDLEKFNKKIFTY